MSKVLVTESYLEDIGDAIRAKLETEDTYKPSQMARAIDQISGGATLITKNITENGTYNASDDEADGYSSVTVDVAGGGVVAFLKIEYTIGAICSVTDGVTTLTAPDTTGYWVAELPNIGTWNVTLTKGTKTKTDSVTIAYADSLDEQIAIFAPEGYTQVEYLATESTAGPYINTGVEQKATSYFELEMQYTDRPNNDMWAFGTLYGQGANEIGYYGTTIYFYIDNSGYTKTFDTTKHKYVFNSSGCYVDGVQVNSRTGSNRSSYYYDLFARGGVNGAPNGQTTNCRIYGCKIYDGDTLVRDFVPCYRDSDNEAGMYDIVNDVFYTNDGTGSFAVGADV